MCQLEGVYDHQSFTTVIYTLPHSKTARSSSPEKPAPLLKHNRHTYAIAYLLVEAAAGLLCIASLKHFHNLVTDEQLVLLLMYIRHSHIDACTQARTYVPWQLNIVS